MPDSSNHRINNGIELPKSIVNLGKQPDSLKRFTQFYGLFKHVMVIESDMEQEWYSRGQIKSSCAQQNMAQWNDHDGAHLLVIDLHPFDRAP